MCVDGVESWRLLEANQDTARTRLGVFRLSRVMGPEVSAYALKRVAPREFMIQVSNLSSLMTTFGVGGFLSLFL